MRRSCRSRPSKSPPSWARSSPPQLAAEIGSRLSTRIEGTCIKHKFGSCSLKLYDKFARILRIETTTNDVSFFKHHRKVEHRSGRATREVAPLKKSIYSLIDLREILLGCNDRYLAFLSSLDDHSSGSRLLERVTHPKPDGHRTFKGLNFFDSHDQALLRAVQRPEFNIHGLARSDLMVVRSRRAGIPFKRLSNTTYPMRRHLLN